MSLRHGMGYHTPGEVVFQKNVVISELDILYRLEKMVVGN